MPKSYVPAGSGPVTASRLNASLKSPSGTRAWAADPATLPTDVTSRQYP